jgi:tetrahydromethanopterin S-methyltransferase subunit F
VPGGGLRSGRLQLITRNRRLAAVLALIAVAVAFVAGHVSAWLVSPGVMILPILAAACCCGRGRCAS